MRDANTRPRVILLTKDAAEYLGVAVQTLRSWRVNGRGPAFIFLATNRIGYERTELERFVSERRFRSNAERKARALVPNRDSQRPPAPRVQQRTAPGDCGPDRAA